jgi:hypothetical protein
MRGLRLAVGLVFLAGPVCAQVPSMGDSSGSGPTMNLAPQDRRLTSEELEREKAIDNAYKSTLKKIPDQKRTADPWGTVRSSGSPTAAPAKVDAPKARSAPQTTSRTQPAAR